MQNSINASNQYREETGLSFGSLSIDTLNTRVIVQFLTFIFALSAYFFIFRKDSSTTSHTKHYNMPVEPYTGNLNYNGILNFTSLTPNMQNIKIDLVLTRENPVYIDSKLTIRTLLTLLRHSYTIDATEDKKIKHRLHMNANSVESSPINILNNFNVTNFDAVNLHFFVDTEMKNINNIKVILDYEQTSQQNIIDLTKWIIPVLSVILVAILSYKLNPSTELFALMVIHGVISCIATVPIYFITDSVDVIHAYQLFFSHVIFNYNRFFITAAILNSLSSYHQIVKIFVIQLYSLSTYLMLKGFNSNVSFYNNSIRYMILIEIAVFICLCCIAIKNHINLKRFVVFIIIQIFNFVLLIFFGFSIIGKGYLLKFITNDSLVTVYGALGLTMITMLAPMKSDSGFSLLKRNELSDNSLQMGVEHLDTVLIEE